MRGKKGSEGRGSNLRKEEEEDEAGSTEVVGSAVDVVRGKEGKRGEKRGR